MINVMASLSSGFVCCTTITLIVSLSARLCNASLMLPFQGHPHHHREDQTSCVTVHPCKLDLRTLARPKVFPAASDGCLFVHDHLAGGSVRNPLVETKC